MSAFYNEIDDFAAEWLRQLIKAGHIADGIVDQRGYGNAIVPEVGATFVQAVMGDGA